MKRSQPYIITGVPDPYLPPIPYNSSFFSAALSYPSSLSLACPFVRTPFPLLFTPFSWPPCSKLLTKFSPQLLVTRLALMPGRFVLPGASFISPFSLKRSGLTKYQVCGASNLPSVSEAVSLGFHSCAGLTFAHSGWDLYSGMALRSRMRSV